MQTIEAPAVANDPLARVVKYECVELRETAVGYPGRHGTVRAISPTHLAIHFCETATTVQVPRFAIAQVILGARHGCRVPIKAHEAARRRNGQHTCCGEKADGRHAYWCSRSTPAERIAAGLHGCCANPNYAEHRLYCPTTMGAGGAEAAQGS